MGNIFNKRIDFKKSKLYNYEMKNMHLSENRIVAIHIFQKKLKDNSDSDSVNYRSDSKTIFFVHGVAGNSGIWWQQIDFFVELNYKIIAIDLLGHGSSYRSKIFDDYKFYKLANDCLSIFDEFSSKSEPNILVGHSYGCSMVTYIAYNRQNHVSRMVLISGGSSLALGDPDWLFQMTTCCLCFLHPIILSVFRSRAFNGEMNNWCYGVSSVNIESFILKAIIIGQVWDEGNTDYHRKIKTPTLLIHGEEDGMVKIEEEMDMLNTLPFCELKTITNTGHMSMLKAPAIVNNFISVHIKKDWDSKYLPLTNPPSVLPTQTNQSKATKSTLNITRSFSLFTKAPKINMKEDSNIKESNANECDRANMSNRKTLPSNPLVRRKSTRLSLKRANSRRYLSHNNNYGYPIQETIVEDMYDSIV